MEKFFELTKNGTSVKQEFIAALVTFCSMLYILIVNANMYANPFGNGGRRGIALSAGLRWDVGHYPKLKIRLRGRPRLL